ncbi:LysR family transcriptional regulator [Paenibacillus thailandensis]|uniref:LysR family transcriptional regulator n=1 Tax=Paenibacillus thailandensis TaxID=393250 RepID=A0ABW5QVK5_9BACL
MDLRTLKTLHLIIKYGSFIRAAEELNYAQSTVTMQIQKLEAELGIQLLERGKTIRLTEPGRLFYEKSLDIVRQLEQLQTQVTDVQTGEAGTVRLGVTEPNASYRLPRLMQRFMAEHPKIRVSIEVSNTPALAEALMRGNIDFALCSTPDNTGFDLYFEPLFQERFVLLMPQNHPLSVKETVEPIDLHEHRLFITSATCPYRKQLEVMLRQSGNVSGETMEIGSMTALKHYVETGLGIALVPQIQLEAKPTGTTVRAMKGDSVHMLTGLARRTSPLMKAAETLYRFLERELPSISFWNE